MSGKPVTRGRSKGKVAGLDTSAPPQAASVARCIAGIGASAGGYEAIRSFFKAMPDDSGIAFVVVQHLDPKHASMAAELFAKCTAMPVVEAADGALIEANHVYTGPSDRDVVVRDGRLYLTPRDDTHHGHFPIDRLFASLGVDRGAGAIGIVLSGTGTDGTLGLKEIAAHGGIVVVQDPATAQFDGMPRSAMAAGVASYVMKVEQMPAVLAGYARHPYVAGSAETDEDEGDARATQKLIEIIQARRGYDFSGYKRGTLLRRIRRRMGLRGILRETQYVALLKKEPAEADALFRDLLIGVTEFFRDPDAWKVLDDEVIAPLVASRPSDMPIRIWIPGCSTGEEAYTMAMVVLDRLRVARKTCALQIFATDTNNEALEVGRAGRYPVGIAARVSPARLRRYFVAGGDRQHYTVSAELRSAVVFGAQNLFADPPFGRVDLISCRNVLIYLEPELQRRVLSIFHFALRQDACLFLGTAESNGGRDDLFAPISRKWRIFRRAGSARMDARALPLRAADHGAAVAVPAVRSVPPANHAAGIAQKLILDRFAPASVLIDGNHEALYFCGPTDEFLLRPRGAPTRDLWAMVREGLRARLRAALREAAASGLPVSAEGLRMRRGGGFVPVRCSVTPAAGGELGRLFLVVFRYDAAPPVVVETGAEAGLVRRLEEELQAARDDLQGTVERFESANEDLKVSNEEIVSINEELRSLNEELESSKEELQSLNEELTTVNQQLEQKVRELESANNDLHNLLDSSDIATLCLDKNLRIKWFTPATRAQFNLIPGDVGRPVSDVVSALEDGELIEAARTVVTGGVSPDRELEVGNGRRYIRRVLPYKDEDGKVIGVILTYTDVTDVRLADEAVRSARHDLSMSQEHGDDLRRLSAALAMAEERERRALAQDLHDDLGQILAVINLKIKSLQQQKMPPALRHDFESCADVVDKANRKMRSMAFRLNPPMLHELGFIAALEWIAEEMQATYGLTVRIENDGASLPPLDAAVSATLYRAVRELLINVAKHARVAEAVVGAACGDGDTVVVTVSDAGAGFDPDAKPAQNGINGFGLISVRERIGFLGGTLMVRSNPGDGTTVRLQVPAALAQPAASGPAQEGRS